MIRAVGPGGLSAAPLGSDAGRNALVQMRDIHEVLRATVQHGRLDELEVELRTILEQGGVTRLSVIAGKSMTSRRSTSPAARSARFSVMLPWERIGTSVSRFNRSTAVTASSEMSVEFCPAERLLRGCGRTRSSAAVQAVVIRLVVLDDELPELAERGGPEHEHLILCEGPHPILAKLRALLAPIAGPAPAPRRCRRDC